MLLVSDANIFIDLEVSGLTRQLFLLPHEIVVPDTLYDQELKLRHAQLLELGLQLRVLSGAQVAEVFDLQAKYPAPSLNDLFALVLAKSLQCPLATGDARLRQAAAGEGLELLGSLTLLEQMIAEELITLDDLRRAYRQMRDSNRRLPWGDVETQLARLTTTRR
jgi:hypothetical protein